MRGGQGHISHCPTHSSIWMWKVNPFQNDGVLPGWWLHVFVLCLGYLATIAFFSRWLFRWRMSPSSTCSEDAFSRSREFYNPFVCRAPTSLCFREGILLANQAGFSVSM